MNCESIQDTYKIKCSDCETVDEARIESSKTWNPFKEFITIFSRESIDSNFIEQIYEKSIIFLLGKFFFNLSSVILIYSLFISKPK